MLHKKRIFSIDVLRGATIAAMILVNTPGTWSNVYAPLLHAKWHGYTPTDLIFPFFIFIVGISIVLAYQKRRDNKKAARRKILIRTLKILFLGLFLNAFIPNIPFFQDFETLRFLGVLQRIGLAFVAAALAYLYFGKKTIIAITAILLIGYWLIMGYLPFADGQLPSYERVSNNWALFIDQHILGQHMWKEDYDPEGLFSTLPAIASALLGIITGFIIISQKTGKKMKCLYIFLFGIALLMPGYLLKMDMPVNKALWTSSFVLVTAGWGCIILSGIYWLTDIWNIRKWGMPFVYFGANAITVYFLSSFVSKMFYMIKFNTSAGETSIHEWLYQNIFVWDFLAAKTSSLLYGLSVVLFYLLLGYLMYRRKIFIKV